VSVKYKKSEIVDIVNKIDELLLAKYQESKLSLQRKELISKFIDLRIKTLLEVLE